MIKENRNRLGRSGIADSIAGLIIRHGCVAGDVAADGGELLAEPGGVGVDGLAENQFVADGEDDRVHGGNGRSVYGKCENGKW